MPASPLLSEAAIPEYEKQYVLLNEKKYFKKFRIGRYVVSDAVVQ